ncbi:hypothetical protein BEN71_15265 [Acinetobacter wuhouensis]|uniref:Uncharacterized protein n=1 Tax=Acinetobacter wuhouensis TaxID=1879050 RepID=A0A385C6K6_9GAMM|nr:MULTISPECIES: hypothetical protein [Acinetobacter]AXQ23347.1 hypothetical protein BEN71_15265 [Acinetobacter wuhouensis]RZG46571.1 hypothetical protein EXU28_08280 [Acinetobacter wuhouensis]RZG72326.1 hypothetical protein EXU29_10410 [Acinetobacter wuhouensis]RZG75449.1 hypothetical protein EXE09_11175 [Acinetobacter sp. WCHAc060025]RZG87240.1 hypothetical protein EXE10_04970 [Acinetobacter sp. WCHAc060033]
MSKFEVEINLPEQNTQSFETDDINQIQAKFYAINWRRIFMSPLNKTEISFAVLNTETQQYLDIQLNTQSSQSEPVFQVESNIQVVTENKEFLGLLTRKKNYDLVYKNLNQAKVSEQLDLFLKENVEAMTEQYKQLLHKKKLQEQRLA